MDDRVNQILALQDVQLVNAISDMKRSGNGAQLSEYTSKRKQELFDRVAKEHSDTFEKTYGDMVRAQNTTNNIMYYYIRNKDLDNLQQAVFQRAKGEADAAQFDNQTSKRQYEVNQWTAGNKQDTLFFLQLAFISFTLMAPLAYLVKVNAIPSSLYVGISSLLGVALILTLIVRMRYTNRDRDQTFWNRRRFATMGGPPAAPSCEAVVGLAAKAQAEYSNIKDQTVNTASDLIGRLQGGYSAFIQ